MYYLLPNDCKKFCTFPISKANSNNPRPIMPMVKRTSQINKLGTRFPASVVICCNNNKLYHIIFNYMDF